LVVKPDRTIAVAEEETVALIKKLFKTNPAETGKSADMLTAPKPKTETFDFKIDFRECQVFRNRAAVRALLEQHVCLGCRV